MANSVCAHKRHGSSANAPDDPKKKRKEKEKLADEWTKNHQPLLIPCPFSLKTISFPRVDDEMLLNIGTYNYPMESRV